MSYKRKVIEGYIWIENQAFEDSQREVARAQGIIDAQASEIGRLGSLLEKFVVVQPLAHPLIPLDAEHEALRS